MGRCAQERRVYKVAELSRIPGFDIKERRKRLSIEPPCPPPKPACTKLDENIPLTPTLSPVGRGIKGEGKQGDLHVKIKKEHIIAASAMILGPAVIFFAGNLPETAARREPGPAFFPYIIGFLLILAGIGEAAEGRKCRNYLDVSFHSGEKRGMFNFVSFAVLISLYILFLEKLGFALLTFLFLLAILNILRIGFLKSALYSLILVAGLYFLFGRIFRVPLPAGIIF